MKEILLYIQLGVQYVMNLQVYEPILFFMTLVIPYAFKNWKQAISLSFLFAFIYFITLTLSMYEVFIMEDWVVETILPMTVVMTASINFTHTVYNSEKIAAFFSKLSAVSFGVIYGCSFYHYLKIVVGVEEDMAFPILGFSIGAVLSQAACALFIFGAVHVVWRWFGVSRIMTIRGLSSVFFIIGLTIFGVMYYRLQ